MKRIHIFLIFCIVLLMSGCGTSDDITVPDDKGEETPGTEEPGGEIPGPEEPGLNDPVVIGLSGSGMESLVVTRALPAFPNSEQIGVVGAEYSSGAAVNWASYSYINNAVATVSRTDDVTGTYYFGWQEAKYFPLNGDSLVFMAYSPAANNSSVILDNTHTGLTLQLAENMPDVMYASKNDIDSIIPYAKRDTFVNLGEFRHALTQLTIRVLGDDSGANPNVRLDTLFLETDYRSAHLDLLQGDNGFSLNAPERFTYELVKTSTDFVGLPNGITHTRYVYPGTEDDTRLRIILRDGYFKVDTTYLISDFNTASGNPIEFERGYRNILTLRVVGLTVEQPTDAIELEGQLTDWENMGEYEVNVK